MASTSEIRNCSLGYQCKCRWNELKKLSDAGVRFCKTCKKEVYDCTSVEELAKNIALNRSVHVGKDIFEEVKTPSITHIEKMRHHRLPGMIPRPEHLVPAVKKIKPQEEYNSRPIEFDDDVPF